MLCFAIPSDKPLFMTKHSINVKMWDCFEINPKTFFIWRLCLVISKNNNSGMKFHYSDVSLIEKLTLDEPTNLTTAYNMSHKNYAKTENNCPRYAETSFS